jgi:hypothetical protein
VLILAKETPNMELWEMAARYSFQELEQYCRKDPNIWGQIESVIRDPSEGIKYFLGRQLSVDFVNQLFLDFTRRLQDDVQWLRHCSNLPFGSHLDATHRSQITNETREGRFGYVEPLGNKNCRLCAQYSK